MFCCAKHYATSPRGPTSCQTRDADVRVSPFFFFFCFFTNMWNSLKLFSRCSLLVCLRFRWKIPTSEREKDARWAAEPAMTELLLSGDGMVWWFGLIVALFCCLCRSREDFLHHLDLNWRSVFHTRGWCFFFFTHFISSLWDSFPQETFDPLELRRLKQNKQNHGFLLFLLWYYWGGRGGSWHLSVTAGNTSCSHGPHCPGQVLSNITRVKASRLTQLLTVSNGFLHERRVIWES